MLDFATRQATAFGISPHRYQSIWDPVSSDYVLNAGSFPVSKTVQSVTNTSQHSEPLFDLGCNKLYLKFTTFSNNTYKKLFCTLWADLLQTYRNLFTICRNVPVFCSADLIAWRPQRSWWSMLLHLTAKTPRTPRRLYGMASPIWLQSVKRRMLAP